MINENAIALCKQLYYVLEKRGVYPALTGGTLYKNGERKDIDIVLYRASSGTPLNVTNIWDELCSIGIFIKFNYDRVAKCTWKGLEIDLIFPEGVGVYGESPMGHDKKQVQISDKPLFSLGNLK